jgi:hypothetical protein
MREIRISLNKPGFDLIHKQGRRLETDSYSPKNIEIKISFINSMYVDCHDA